MNTRQFCQANNAFLANVERLIEAATTLRKCQRAYMAARDQRTPEDREALGKAVQLAAERVDVAIINIEAPLPTQPSHTLKAMP